MYAGNNTHEPLLETPPRKAVADSSRVGAVKISPDIPNEAICTANDEVVFLGMESSYHSQLVRYAA